MNFMDSIKSDLEALSIIDVPALERKGKDYNFSDVHPLIVEMFEHVETIKTIPNFGVHFTDEMQSNISQCLHYLHEIVMEIQKFDPLQERPRDAMEHLSANIRSIYKEACEHLIPQVKLAVLEKKVSNQEIEGLVEQAKEELASIQQKEKELDAVLKTVDEARKVSAGQGGLQFKNIFGTQAARKKATANRWLIATGLLAIAIGGILFNGVVFVLDIWLNDVKIDTHTFLQLTVAKILLMSFLLIVFYQAVKNYNVNMHLYALNEHRENVMASFQSLIQATDDPNIRDAVLTQATKTIFEAGETGYVSSKGDGGSVPLIESIKNVIQHQAKEP